MCAIFKGLNQMQSVVLNWAVILMSNFYSLSDTVGFGKKALEVG